MKTICIVLIGLICIASLTAQDPVFPRTEPPFSTHDFCVVIKPGDAQDRFTIQYIRKREFTGTITFKQQIDSEAKIRLPRPVEESEGEVDLRAGEATHEVKLGSSEGAMIWNRSGQQITTAELREKLIKPLRAIMLREKPQDWRGIRDHALFLDLEVIFIYPGDFFVAVEKAER